MKDIYRGDLYYADLDPTIGSEQGGVRPVLVLQNNVGNKHSPTTIVAAITSSKTKAKMPTHVEIKKGVLSTDSTILLEQIRTIDKTRLDRYLGTIDNQTMRAVDKAVLISFGLDYLEVLRNG